MNTITINLDPSTIPDETELTETQLASLQLWRLPKKVRLRVRRPNGNVQLQHIGKMIHITLTSETDCGSWEDYESVYKLVDEALHIACWDLRGPNYDNPPYRHAMEGRIEIAVPEKITGGEALETLGKAVEEIVQKANSLLTLAAKGIRLKQPEDRDWWAH